LQYDTDPSLQDLYWRPEGMTHPFRDIVRLKLINLMLQAPTHEGGCGLPLRKLVAKKVILAFYPLHDHEKLDQIAEKINQWCRMPWDTPNWEIKEYFGEKIGLYFTFLSHLTTWCLYVSIFGLIAQIHVVATNNRSASTVPVFAIIVSFWAVLMLEFWKRKEKQTAMEWGMVGFEDEEKDRPEFYGENMKSFINGKEVLFFPDAKKYLLLTQSFITIACMVCIVVGFVAGIYAIRFAIQEQNKTAASPVASILNSIQIQFCNFVFGKIAELLTERENHRTDTQYEDSLIAKLFAFQFVNSFSSFVYVAFIQTSVENVEQPPMDALALNLAIIFGSRLISGNIFEVLVPVMMAKRKFEKETAGTDGNLSPPEEEYIRQPYDIIKGPLKDYAELAIQFGYITLFVVALPSAPFLAFISNYVEIRTDGHKLLKFHQRPVPTGAEDIGTWQTIFTLVAGAAVVSNAALTFFTMDTFDNLSDVSSIWYFIGFQYLVFAIMYVFSILVPDEPEFVAIQPQRQNYLVEKVIERIADEDESDLLEALAHTTGDANIRIADRYE
jgi:anoctamin-10/anoctamin-7